MRPLTRPFDFMLIVFTSSPSVEVAEKLAEGLVAERLAGCVQVLPQMTSFYYWEGAVQRDPEHLLLIKTSKEKYPAVEEFITRNHPYSVPEIVAVDAEKAADSYSKWLKDYLA